MSRQAPSAAPSAARPGRGNAWALGAGVVLLVVGGTWLLRELGLWPGAVPVSALVLIALGAVVLVSGLRSRALTPQPAVVPLAEAGAAAVRLEHGAGTVRLRGGAPVGQLVAGTFTGGVSPEVRSVEGRQEVVLRPPAELGRLLGPGRPLDWDLAVTEAVPVSLDLRTGAGRLRLDCGALQVPELRLQTGASDVEVTLPARGHTRAKISAGAADVRVRVPEGVAARIRNRSALAGVRIDQRRFPVDDGEHRSAGWETAPNRVDLELEGGVASFTVE